MLGRLSACSVYCLLAGVVLFFCICPAIKSPFLLLSYGIGIDSVVDSHEAVRRRNMWCLTVLDASDSLEPRFLTEAICFGIERNKDETIRNNSSLKNYS